jgi:hypothetical protein
MKQGDVNGDGFMDNVFLYGNKHDDSGAFVKGEVLAVAALNPIVINEKSMSHDLLVFQRIIGISNSDTLGYVENLLTWNGTQFISARLATVILGTKLSSLN